MAFTGYSRDTFGFLAGLVHHNEKTWFEAHRDDYKRFVVEPSLALIVDLDEAVRRLSPHYRGVPKALGGSLMRIYRDVRFSRDKTPYKTNIGIQLRHVRGNDVHAPGWYIHADLSECFVGAGSWHPEPADLKDIRRALAADPKKYHDALAAAAQEGLTPAGDSAVRVPVGFDPAHPAATELKRKDFLVSKTLDPELFLSPHLVTELTRAFAASAPYMGWLCRTRAIEF